MTFRTLLFSLMLTCCSSNAFAANTKDIEAKVEELNTQSIKLLGVSLNAVRYLVGASPDSYLLLSSLERSGEIAYIRELEVKGYVKLQVVQGLPDAMQRNEKFLRVIPIGEGEELQRCVVALKHNPAFKRDALKRAP